MPFQVAGAAEVLRATQKDESFLNYLKSCISEIVQRTLGKYCYCNWFLSGIHYIILWRWNVVWMSIFSLTGTRTWLDVHKNAEVLCEIVYYGLTTLCLRQTLGEEYTGILQVDSSRRKLPNFLVSYSEGWILFFLLKEISYNYK